MNILNLICLLTAILFLSNIVIPILIGIFFEIITIFKKTYLEESLKGIFWCSVTFLGGFYLMYIMVKSLIKL